MGTRSRGKNLRNTTPPPGTCDHCRRRPTEWTLYGMTPPYRGAYLGALCAVCGDNAAIVRQMEAAGPKKQETA